MSTDTSWMLWNAQPPKLPRPGEPLFTLVKDHRRTVCELRYHGEYGVEAKFLDDGELAFSLRCGPANQPKHLCCEFHRKYAKKKVCTVNPPVAQSTRRGTAEQGLEHLPEEYRAGAPEPHGRPVFGRMVECARSTPS